MGGTIDAVMLRLRRSHEVSLTAGVEAAQAAADGSPGGGGAFFVDPQRAAACVAAVREIASRLDLVVRLGWRTRLVEPPGEDPVSTNMAAQARIMAERAHEFVLAWQAQLHAAADGLERQLRDYRRADDGAAGAGLA